MDVKEYISSGILESVVLGFASEQERQEVSCLSHIYPEIGEELKAVELSFEKMAFEMAVEPAKHLRQSVLEAISKEQQISVTSEKSEAKIVQMSSTMSSSNSEANPWKWMAAAAVVLAVGIGALWVNSRSEMNAVSTQMASLQEKNIKNEQVLSVMSVEQERLTAIQAVLSDRSTKNVVMAGTPMEPTASVKVMWSADSKKAVMVADKIAPPPTDMQYQLWAIADGKPVSLGVFNYDDISNLSEPFDVNAKNISAFAITLEKRGGSPTPTMDKMVVLGAIS